ncbi:MAG: hypothetical protein ACK4S4_01200 [Pyrinomonadaceae bacterium]
MHTTPLTVSNHHLFASIDGRDWLVDTGAPTSFGDLAELVIDDWEFSIPQDYLGLSADRLSQHVGHSTAGLIGVDILNEFDTVFDIGAGEISFSDDAVACDGDVLSLDQFMGIPIADVTMQSKRLRVFVDTGAQIGYLPRDVVSSQPSMGAMTDFYPGVGEFETDTYLVQIRLGGCELRMRCGCLPGLLGMTLQLAGVDGILSNQIFIDRKVGYFPRRGELVLA